MKGLRKCPVCGSYSVRLETDWDHKGDKIHVVYAQCQNCHGRTRSMPTMQEAQDEWNSGTVTNNGYEQMNLFDLSKV